jgi:hypothetical protein
MRSALRVIGLAAIVAAAASCGNVVRDSRAPAYLIINTLAGARGNATLGTFGSTLISDVITNVVTPAPCSTDNPCPTVFGDLGQVALSLGMRDPGTVTSPTAPSTANAITITRYHVSYRRADGRNTPGVDVPFGFDGAITATVVGSTATTMGFTLVRLVAKQESPLVQLKFNSVFITALADVTFYGRDQVGNEISISGTIQVDFGNFGD